MSQAKYVEKRFNMHNWKPRLTPCEQKLNYTADATLMNHISRYREAVGSMIFDCTRPDLSCEQTVSILMNLLISILGQSNKSCSILEGQVIRSCVIGNVMRTWVSMPTVMQTELVM